MNILGDPVLNDPFFYSEVGDSLRNLHIRIISYNQFVGLFTGNAQLFLLKITFNDPSNPTLNPVFGSIIVQKT
jgi:hypothetical protein